MAKKLFKNKSLWKKIGIGAVAGVLGLGAVMGVGALLDKEDETMKSISPTYAVGGLTEDGAYLDTKASIYTENAFECQGLDIDMAFKHDISYRVFFYDEDNDFISATTKQTGNYDENTTPSIACYARIVITPNDDDEIKWHEIKGYAKQLSIEVNREQVDIDIPYKGTNRFEYLECYNASSYGTGTSTIVFSQANDPANGYNLSNLVSTNGCKNVSIKVDKELMSSVKIIQLSETAKLSSVYLSELDFEEVVFENDTYIISTLDDNCDGFFLQTDIDTDISNFAIYVW